MEFVAVDVTRQALGVSYPDEVEDLDAAVERFERAARARFLPPVRMGVEMLPLADHLLPVVAALLGAVGGALAEQAATLLSERTKALMARRCGHPQDPFVPLAPEQEEEVRAAVVLMLHGKVTQEEADVLGLAVVGALRLSGGERE